MGGLSEQAVRDFFRTESEAKKRRGKREREGGFSVAERKESIVERQ